MKHMLTLKNQINNDPLVLPDPDEVPDYTYDIEVYDNEYDDLDFSE